MRMYIKSAAACIRNGTWKGSCQPPDRCKPSYHRIGSKGTTCMYAHGAHLKTIEKRPSCWEANRLLVNLHYQTVCCHNMVRYICVFHICGYTPPVLLLLEVVLIITYQAHQAFWGIPSVTRGSDPSRFMACRFANDKKTIWPILTTSPMLP